MTQPKVDVDDNEIYCPSVDVCAWCTDVYCDGVGCIASLDPNDPADQDQIGRLHATIRAGLIWTQADRILARAENRR